MCGIYIYIYIYIQLNEQGIAHLDVVVVDVVENVELNMAHNNLNCAILLIDERVVQYIGFNVQHIEYAFTCTLYTKGE